MTNSINVEKLSKQYRIGELHRETMLRERLINIIKHPFLRKKKETIWALKDVSFSVMEKELSMDVKANELLVTLSIVN